MSIISTPRPFTSDDDDARREAHNSTQPIAYDHTPHHNDAQPVPLNVNTRYTGKQVDEITIIAEAELVDVGATAAVASAPPAKEDGGKGEPAMAEAVPMATVSLVCCTRWQLAALQSPRR